MFALSSIVAAVAIFGLLLYFFVRILRTWQQNDRNLAVWLIVLGLFGGAFIGLLFWVATQK